MEILEEISCIELKKEISKSCSYLDDDKISDKIVNDSNKMFYSVALYDVLEEVEKLFKKQQEKKNRKTGKGK